MLPSLAAVVQAAAAVPSNAPLRSQGGAGTAHSSRSEQPSSLSDTDNLDALVARALQAGRGIGPKLANERRKQLADRIPLESYSIEQARNLFLYVPRSEIPEHSKVLCREVHGKGCRKCSSCIACRQKLVESLTWCHSCQSRFGRWCRSCLRDRIGENGDEVIGLSSWVCPPCRGVCTCSTVGCIRKRMQWFETKELSSEAREQGYSSTGHYLVLIHLNDEARALLAGVASLPAGASVAACQPQNRKRKRRNERPEQEKQAMVEARFRLERERRALEQLGLGDLLEAPTAPSLGAGDGGPASSDLGELEDLAVGPSEVGGGLLQMAAMLARDLEGDEYDVEEHKEEEEDRPGLQRSFVQQLASQLRSAERAGRGPSAARQSALPAAAAASASPGGAAVPAAALASPWAAGGAAGSLWGAAAGSPGAAAAAGASWGSQGMGGTGDAGLCLSLIRPRGPRPRAAVAPAQPQQPQPAEAPPFFRAQGGHGGASSEPGHLLPPRPPLAPGVGRVVGGVGAPGAGPFAANAAGGTGSSSCPADTHCAVSCASAAQNRGPSGAAEEGDDGGDRKRQKLEALLHLDGSWEPAVHDGLPCGDGQGGSGRAPRPVQSRAGLSMPSRLPLPPHRQAHITPPLPRHAAVAATAKVHTHHSGDAAGGAAPSMQRHPAESGTGAVAAVEEAAAADSSGQLGLPPADAAVAPSSSEVQGRPGARAGSVAEGSRGSPAAGGGLTPPAALAAVATPTAVMVAPPRSTAGPLVVTAQAPAPAPAQPSGPGPVERDAQEWFGMYKACEAEVVEYLEAEQAAQGGSASAEELCTLADRRARQQVREALLEAERVLGRLEEAVPFSLHGRITGDQGSCSMFCSLQGLRSCLRFYNYLALYVDPRECDIIVNRLLGRELFVDFDRSDAVARNILLLEGWLPLLRTMHAREQAGVAGSCGVRDVVEALAEAAARMGAELGQASAWMDKLDKREVGDLLDGHRIGPWQFDSNAKLSKAREELDIIYNLAMPNVVLRLLRELAPAALCLPWREGGEYLALASTAFLTKEVLRNLLDPGRQTLANRKSAAAIRSEMLVLLSQALDFVGGPHTEALMDLSRTQLEQRRAARARLCGVVKEAALPLLEELVGMSCPRWRPQGSTAPVHKSNQLPMSANQDKLEICCLGHCYGFLVSNKVLHWDAVVSAASRPYAFDTFWSHVTTFYRNAALFLLASALKHAPTVLEQQTAREGLLWVWAAVLLDLRSPHGAQILTQQLASNPHTAPLFGADSIEALGKLVSEESQERAGSARTLLVGVVGRMAMSADWRRELACMLAKLKQVLEAGSKEITNGVKRTEWQLATAGTVLCMLREALPRGPGRPPPVDAATAERLHTLLNLIATWAVRECTELMKLWLECASSDAAGAGGEATSEEQQRGLVRTMLKASVFGLLGDMWELLASCGAPGCFSSTQSLLLPLLTVISSCIEMCPGADANSVESVMLELLAQSLAPRAPAPGAPGSPALHPLCAYVLSTFVRRYLSRASIDHESSQRAAVVTLRFVEALLSEPSMRSTGPTLEALRHLMRPLLDLICPVGQAPQAANSSPAVREALYRLLTSFLTSSDEHAALLQSSLPPPAGQPSWQQPQHSQQARQQQQQHGESQVRERVQRFFQLAAQSVQQSVYSALEELGGMSRADLDKYLRFAAKPNRSVPSPLLAPTAQEWTALSNSLLVLGRPSPLDVLSALYDKRVPAAALSSMAGSGQGRFLPGTSLWEAANAGGSFLQALVTSQAAPQLALRCFGALHYLILGSRERGRKLQEKLYKPLRQELEEVLGSDALSAYRFKDHKAAAEQQQRRLEGARGSLHSRAVSCAQSQVRPAGPAPGQTAAAPHRNWPLPPPVQQQQQQQQQSRPLRGSAGALVRPAEPHWGEAAQSQGSRPTQASQQYSADQRLSRLVSLPVEADLPLTALLRNKGSDLQGQSGSLLLELRDFEAGGGGAAHHCMVAVDQRELVAQLVAQVDSEDPCGDPVVLRLTHLRLQSCRNPRNGLPVLKSTSRTEIEVQPRLEHAEWLRSQARRRPSPTSQQHSQQRRQQQGRQQQQQQQQQLSEVPGPSTQHGLASAATLPLQFSQAQPGQGLLSQRHCTGTAECEERAGDAGLSQASGWVPGGAAGAAAAGPPQERQLRRERPAESGVLPATQASQLLGGQPAGARTDPRKAVLWRLADEVGKEGRWIMTHVPRIKEIDTAELERQLRDLVELQKEVLEKLKAMGYSGETAMEAAKAVWGNHPAAELVRRAVEHLEAGR